MRWPTRGSEVEAWVGWPRLPPLFPLQCDSASLLGPVAGAPAPRLEGVQGTLEEYLGHHPRCDWPVTGT